MPVEPVFLARPRIAFVTGATGLLGNNLVRELLADGWQVRALVRTLEKGREQFPNGDIEIIKGDMLNVSDFEAALKGVDTVFHTAACFRDAYKGGKHWEELYAVNVDGTRLLLECARRQGVQRFIHTSSIAVLYGHPGQQIDETMLRAEEDADDYYRSKILSDQVVLSFLNDHPDFWATIVLPGWMHGPGDRGPTSAGQTFLDVAHGRLPGIPPGSFSIVDARDVARGMILASERGRRGERYLAAGQHMTMAELIPLIARITGARSPTRKLPLPLLYLIAAGNEAFSRITGKHVLLSWATVRTIAREAGRSHYNPRKSEQELGLKFRSPIETLQDEANWFQENGYPLSR